MGGLVQNATDIIVLVVFFGLTIFVHELGHFLVALKCGMVVDTFSIGFGPAMWKRKIRGITFKIGVIPVGGYVALPQLDPSGMASVQGEQDGKDEDQGAKPRALTDISPWYKILVSLAGATGNIILAFVLAVTIWASPKAITYPDTAEIGEVAEGCIAHGQGLRPGDAIVAVNGKPVTSWYDYSMECLLVGETNSVTLTVASEAGEREINVPLVKGDTLVPVVPGVARKGVPCLFADIMPGGSAEAAGLKPGDVVLMFDGIKVDDRKHFVELVGERDGQEVPIVVDRQGEILECRVRPEFNEEAGQAIVGVKVVGIIMPWMHEKRPLAQLKSDAMAIVRLLRALVTPGESRNAAKGLGGPFAIFATLWISIKVSMFNAVGFLRFLNVNLAILNLLPIPVLDGGHIVFSLWEGVSRRKVHPRIVNVLINVFAVLLIVLVAVLTLKDVDTFVPKARRIVFFWRDHDADAEATNAVPEAAEARSEEATSPE